MNRSRPEVAVIVAATDPPRDLDRTIARLAAEAGPRGEVIVVEAVPGKCLARLTEPRPNLRWLQRASGRLAPLLWSDGLLVTDAPLVAFTTLAMVPEPGWLAALRNGLAADDLAGIGGPIAPDSRLSATDRAVALLRYSAYFLPLPGKVEPPGDNALYRRDRLGEVESVWADGFWEVEVHRALRDRGHRLGMARSAVVTFEGGAGLARMVLRRFAHGRVYGAGRSREMTPWLRLVRIASAPLVPPLLLRRVVAALRSRGMPLIPWLTSLPALAVLATAWATGEAVGVGWDGAELSHKSNVVAKSIEKVIP